MHPSSRQLIRFWIVLFGVLFLVLENAFSQGLPSGIYIVIPMTRKCANQLTNLDGSKSFCLPDVPVISRKEFENVSNVMFDNARQSGYLMVKLTNDGFKALKVLTEKLPDSNFVLVTGDKVAGVFELKGRLLTRQLPVYGGKNPLDMDWIFQSLMKDQPLAGPEKK